MKPYNLQDSSGPLEMIPLLMFRLLLILIDVKKNRSAQN
jgi:hypothetical protein